MTDKELKWDAQLYQKSSQFQFNLGLLAIERLAPKDGENILEIGSGNAMLTIEIAKRIPNGSVTAVEFSKEMIDQAIENCSNAGVTNIQFVNINALKILYDQEFDAVFSNSAIHWISDLETMYGLIYRALKPSGRMLIQTGLKEVNTLVRAVMQIIKVKEFQPFLKNFNSPWRFLTVHETEKLLGEVNFKDLVVEVYPYRVKFESEDDVMNYYKAAALVPFYSLIPENLKEKLTETFKNIIFKLSEPDPLVIQMNRLFISASKL